MQCQPQQCVPRCAAVPQALLNGVVPVLVLLLVACSQLHSDVRLNGGQARLSWAPGLARRETVAVSDHRRAKLFKEAEAKDSRFAGDRRLERRQQQPAPASAAVSVSEPAALGAPMTMTSASLRQPNKLRSISSTSFFSGAAAHQLCKPAGRWQ